MLRNIFTSLFHSFAKFIFSLRYRVKISGLNELEGHLSKKNAGALFLPNHSAQIDPLIMSIYFWPKYKIRPLAVEYVCRFPFFGALIRLVRGVSIPNFDTSINQYKVKKAEESFATVVEGLKNRDNFLIYPAGRLKGQPKEIIGGSSGVHDLIQKCPETEIILVRISGFYGSSFSKAFTKNPPDLGQTLKKNLLNLLKNGIFLIPRRNIYIEVEPAPVNLPKTGTKAEFNAFLENWYNRFRDDHGQIHENEPLKLVSYRFWKNDLPFPGVNLEKNGSLTPIPISEDTRTKIYDELRKIIDKPNIEIHPQMSLGADLSMDSLNVAELISFICRKFQLKARHIEPLETVQNALELAEKAKDPSFFSPPISNTSFPDEKNRPAPFRASGDTFPEAFLHACKKMGKYIALSDEKSGNLSYNKCKKSIFVLAEYFSTLPEQRIAVLLPSTAATYIIVLALQFAGKTPVMLNWTLGPRHLEQAMQISEAKRVLTSWAFLEKLFFVDFGSLVNQIEFLEDVKAKLNLKMKLHGLFRSICNAPKVKVSKDDAAVILFTSGTEANPKGVPLSHKNMLSSHKAGYDMAISSFPFLWFFNLCVHAYPFRTPNCVHPRSNR